MIKCLRYYELDPDQVVNAILEENLPPFLENIDRSASKPSSSKRSEPLIAVSKDSNMDSFEGKDPNSKSKSYAEDISAKLLLMSPLNLFYNKVKDSRQTHKDKRSLYFTDLLHPSLGTLKSSLQINFMVEYEWLMMNYEVTQNQKKPLTIIYGEDNAELAANKGHPKQNVNAIRVKPRYPFGTHHTKMMVLVYEDNSVRIVVHTSNLISSDWENRTQGLWVSPKCPLLHDKSAFSSQGQGQKNLGDSTTKFKYSLLRYLNYYEVSALRPFVEHINQCDFSSINAFFVGSVPGSHVINRTDAFQNWGHAFLAKSLCKHNQHHEEIGSDGDAEAVVVAQCSSIGTLGQTLNSSFLMELAASLNATTLRSTKKLPNTVKLVYPTKDNVFNAYGGPLYGGGCLPYSKKTSEKQPWLKEVMCKWESDEIHRTRAMPHIKTYTKLSGYCTQSTASKSRPRASYFMLTSANLSKAAWGSLNKTEDKIFIQSYEAGILLLPKFTHGLTKFSYSVTAEGVANPAELVLPYDLPLTDYDSNDAPWVGEFLMELL